MVLWGLLGFIAPENEQSKVSIQGVVQCFIELAWVPLCSKHPSKGAKKPKLDKAKASNIKHNPPPQKKKEGLGSAKEKKYILY